MKKRLIVCCDGTWNWPDQKGNPTNVVKMTRAILPVAQDGTVQSVFYDTGKAEPRSWPLELYPCNRLRGRLQRISGANNATRAGKTAHSGTEEQLSSHSANCAKPLDSLFDWHLNWAPIWARTT